MELELKSKPKGVTIIEGFPGFGLVGTIATEFLLEHLDAKLIGKIKVEETQPMIAIHKGDLVEPLGIFYNKKHNVVLLHALTSVVGMEWKIAAEVQKLAKELSAKEVISLEGIGSTIKTKEPGTFYLTTKKDGFKKLGINMLKEGIVMGVTSALLLNKKINLSCIFAETHSTLPDSRAAAKVVEVLDKYLGLKIDTKPLIQKAERFEGKIKELFDKSRTATKIKKEKELSYMG